MGCGLLLTLVRVLRARDRLSSARRGLQKDAHLLCRSVPGETETEAPGGSILAGQLAPGVREMVEKVTATNGAGGECAVPEQTWTAASRVPAPRGGKH